MARRHHPIIPEIGRGGGSNPPVEQYPPQLTGGGLDVDGADLVIVFPTLIDGVPPATVEFTLLRDGVDVESEVDDDRIVNAPAGTYVATWVASNGVEPDAVVSDTQVVSGEPEFNVEDVNGTSVVSGSGDIEWTIAEPEEYAGTYTLDQSEEYSGTLNIDYTETVAPQCLKAPVIVRTGGIDDRVGASYSAQPGLWQSSGPLTIEREWHVDGEPTGETGFTFNSIDAGDLTFQETASQPSLADRTAISNTVTVVPATDTRSWFIGADGARLQVEYDDPADRTWVSTSSGSAAFTIYSNRLRTAYGSNTVCFARPNDAVTSGDHRSSMKGKWPATGSWGHIYQGPACNVTPGTLTTQFGYAVTMEATVLRLKKVHDTTSRQSTGGTITTAAYTMVAGAEFLLTIAREGSEIAVYLDGVEKIRVTDTTITTGGEGISAYQNQAGLRANVDGWLWFDRI